MVAHFIASHLYYSYIDYIQCREVSNSFQTYIEKNLYKTYVEITDIILTKLYIDLFYLRC